MSYNIAIDGPAGAGKSTIAKTLAKRCGLIYVDTGAMYRAMGLFMLREGVSETDYALMDEKSAQADISIGYEDDLQVVYLNGENVNGLIRTQEVSNMASIVSTRKVIREKMVKLQQDLAAVTDCVMDGRDIGTTVLPHADVKIYMTASSEVRARRRYSELTAKGIECDYEKIKKEIEDRDYRDMHRELSPLKPADDAVTLDTSDLDVDGVVEKMMQIAVRLRPEE